MGWNPYNLKHMCSTKAWKKFWREMALDLDEGLRKAFDEGKKVTIITVCKSGRDRSTANAELMGHGFKEVYGAETSVEHLCDGQSGATALVEGASSAAGKSARKKGSRPTQTPSLCGRSTCPRFGDLKVPHPEARQRATLQQVQVRRQLW